MIRALFARLTGEPKRGQSLFELAVAEARRTIWFIDGEVPDTINGRFALLATIIALISVRLERDGDAGGQATVALTERLVESLDVEIREMGVGDPTLGKQVRKLVGAVGGRIGRWRALLGTDGPWAGEVQQSLYLDDPASPDALAWSESQLRGFWNRLTEASLDDRCEGRMG